MRAGFLLLAMAAVVLVAVRLNGPGRPTRTNTPDEDVRRGLVVALRSDAARSAAGRLTGGFDYAPPPAIVRGRAFAASAASPDVRIAAAQIDKLALNDRSARVTAARGVAALVVGNPDLAVALLEDATRLEPDSPEYASDLAAAYLARAQTSGAAEDLPRALAAAERALARNPSLLEAHFNRALALEDLHLSDQAREAWQQYHRLDPSSEWAREAQKRAEDLERRNRVSARAVGAPVF